MLYESGEFAKKEYRSMPEKQKNRGTVYGAHGHCAMDVEQIR